MIFNKTIAYISSHKKNALIGAVLGAVVASIIIFLEPFDSENYNATYRLLRLSGYAFCIFIPVVVCHFVENAIYKKQNSRWFVHNEALYLIVVFILILICCSVYNFYVINGFSGLSWNLIGMFIKLYGLPFIPIIFPIWIFLRSTWGKIEISETTNQGGETKIIVGDNKSERLEFLYSKFVYAHSQQNYVALFLYEDDSIKQEMIRITLSNLGKQLPEAWQVHRSYLVNLQYLDSVAGNSRKRQMNLSVNLQPIPISQKYYEALKKHLANSSQKG